MYIFIYIYILYIFIHTIIIQNDHHQLIVIFCYNHSAVTTANANSEGFIVFHHTIINDVD